MTETETQDVDGRRAEKQGLYHKGVPKAARPSKRRCLDCRQHFQPEETCYFMCPSCRKKALDWP